MNVNHILYALETSRCGSISRAAKELYISQSSLTRSIKSLEEQIGIKLFERSCSGVTTTHQGREFLSHAAKLYEQYKCMEDIYFRGCKPNVYHLSISSVRFAVCARAVIELQKEHSESLFQNIVFEEDSVENVVQHVYDGLFRLGILIHSSDKRDHYEGIAKSRNLIYTTLGSQHMYAFMGTHHPLAAKESVLARELMAYLHATMSQSDVSPVNYCSGLENYDFHTGPKRILISDRAALYDILRSTNAYYIGMNLGDTSKCIQDICFKRISDVEVNMDCALIYMKNYMLTDADSEFIDKMKMLLSQTDPQRSLPDA